MDKPSIYVKYISCFSIKEIPLNVNFFRGEIHENPTWKIQKSHVIK